MIFLRSAHRSSLRGGASRRSNPDMQIKKIDCFVFFTKILAMTIFLLLSFPAFAGKVVEVKTPSGITAWLVEEHSQPLLSLNIAFKNSGTAYDPKDKEGLAVFTNAMLSEGAGEMDSESFSRALEDKAIRMSFSADEDNFYASFNSLSEYKENAFSYLALAMLKPRFDEDAIERVKRRTLTAIKAAQEKPNYLLERAWKERMFPGHPYSKEELGIPQTVEKITAKDLLVFTRNNFTRSNIVISATGDITAEELINLLEKNFASLPQEYKTGVKISDINLPTEAKQINLYQDIPQTIVRFGMQGLKRDDKDFITAFVMNYILGGGALNSRLNEELREKRGLTYSAGTSLAPLAHAGIFAGGFATRNEKAQEAIAVLKQTIKDFAEKGINEKELADAKKFLTGSFILSLDGNSDIVNFLTMMQLNNLGIDYMEKRNSLINNVSLSQVNETARKLLNIDKLQIITVGKQ